MKQNRSVGHSVAIDTQKIGHGSLVDYVPIFTQARDELGIVRGRIDRVTVLIEFGGVDNLHVVHVYTDGESLCTSGVVVYEYAIVGIVQLP